MLQVNDYTLVHLIHISLSATIASNSISITHNNDTALTTSFFCPFKIGNIKDDFLTLGNLPLENNAEIAHTKAQPMILYLFQQHNRHAIRPWIIVSSIDCSFLVISSSVKGWKFSERDS